MNDRIYTWMIVIITVWTLHFSEVYNDIGSDKVEEMKVKKGNNITLQCKLLYDYHCSWKKNGHTAIMEQRYTYLNDSAGMKSKDCSIQITEFDIKIDIGPWECVPFITDTHENNSTVFPKYLLIADNITSSISNNDSQDNSKSFTLIYICVSIGVAALAIFTMTCYCITSKRNQRGDNPPSPTVTEYDTNRSPNDVSASLKVDLNNSFVSDKQLITTRKPMPYPRNLVDERAKRTSRSMGCLMDDSQGVRSTQRQSNHGADYKIYSSIPLLNSRVQYADDYDPDINLYDDVLNTKYSNPYEVIPIRHNTIQDTVAPLQGHTSMDRPMLPPKPPIKTGEVIYSQIVLSSKPRNKNPPEVTSSNPPK